MTKPKKTTAPVTSRFLPVVHCAECQQPLPHEPGPGKAATVLTKHYNDEHLTELASPAPR